MAPVLSPLLCLFEGLLPWTLLLQSEVFMTLARIGIEDLDNGPTSSACAAQRRISGVSEMNDLHFVSATDAN